jgi:hypothetical protein
MRIVHSSIALGLALAATPALADEAAASVVGFDLADISGSEVSLPASAVAEMPSPTFGLPKEEPVAEETTAEASSPISGGLDVLSDYMLADGIRPTKGWVIQPYASLDLGGGLSANAWGSVGLKSSVGNELDLGVTYERPLGGGVTSRLTAVHYVLFGDVPDMQEFTVGSRRTVLPCLPRTSRGLVACKTARA